MNQKACYTGLPNISSTVCISRTTQSRSELSADITGVNVEVGVNIVFVYFGKPFMKVRVQQGLGKQCTSPCTTVLGGGGR